ncbi:MAG: alpha/beta hydrolase, partial [Pseudomonadota bacterium]
ALMLLKSGPTADWNMNYETIDVPVLIISGLQDRVFFNAEHVAELAGRISKGQRVDLANAGHMIPVERPVELSDAILKFASGF